MRKYYSNIEEMHNAQLAYSTTFFSSKCKTVYCCGKLVVCCEITDIIGGCIIEKMILCPKCAEQQTLTLKKQQQ